MVARTVWWLSECSSSGVVCLMLDVQKRQEQDQEATRAVKRLSVMRRSRTFKHDLTPSGNKLKTPSTDTLCSSMPVYP